MDDFNIKDSLGYLISKANGLMRINFTRRLNEEGLNATAEQWGILNIINAFPGLTQSEIAEKSLKDKTNVTRMLDVLEKNGNIERQADKKDRRAYRIFITSKGDELLQKMIPLAIESNEMAATGIEKEQLDQFKENLKTLLNNFLNTEL